MQSEVIIVPAVMAFFGWFIHIILKWRQSKYRLNLQLKLVEKISSSEDLVKFISTGAGEKFISSSNFETLSSKNKIMGAIYKGIIFVMLGIALFVIKNVANEIAPAFVIFGAVSFSIGLGYIVATIVSFNLAKKLGMMKTDDDLDLGN